MAKPSPAHADSQLIARIHDGDERAFELLFREHHKRLCTLAASILGSDAAAEELVQETMFHLWEHRERWGGVRTTAGYLYAAVRNRAINQFWRDDTERRWRRRVAQGEELVLVHAQPHGTDDDVTSRELTDAIERAIAELPPRCRQAFILRRQQGLSYAEIARIMGITPKTVEVQIGAALRTLRKRLADWL
jgi:RNA polymerase sigma-70 factor (ECF subfamily)